MCIPQQNITIAHVLDSPILWGSLKKYRNTVQKIRLLLGLLETSSGEYVEMHLCSTEM